MRVLRALSTHAPTGWRLSDLADATQLDHSTVHRMLAVMVQERMASRVPGTRRYALGPLAYELGKASAPYFSLDSLAAPLLSRLANETRSMVFMNLRSGFDSVCIARHEGRHALKAYTVHVGTRRPLAVSAGGVAILIALPRAQQTDIETANLQTLARHGETRRKALQRMLRRSRRLGFGFNLEDIIPGIAALGVAVRSKAGDPVASISLADARTALAESRRSALLQRLQTVALDIEPMLEGLRF